MQSVFNAALLARLRRQPSESMQNLQGLAIGAGDRPGDAAHEVGDRVIERPVQYDPETEKPVTAGDNLSDLDVITGHIAPLPEMPFSWWEQMVLGEGDAWISVANVHLVYPHEAVIEKDGKMASLERFYGRKPPRKPANLFEFM